MKNRSNYTHIKNLDSWTEGKQLLPAGAVPLAMRDEHTLICLMPNGEWISWVPKTPILGMMPSTQRHVIGFAIDNLGGTASKMAAALGVSRKTVEAWRGEYTQLPIAKAFQIAKLLAEKQSNEG